MNKYYRKYVERKCEQCGKTYSVRDDHKTSKYCSRQCAGLSRAKKPIKCEQCGNEFIPARKSTRFCSNKCSSESRLKREIIKCDYCGDDFERNSCHIKEGNKFCSVDCSGKWTSENRVGENATRWKGGVYHQNNKYIHLKQEDGSYKQEHRIVMENHLGRKLIPEEIIHHIDGNGENNEIDNLQIMTRAEHAELHTKQRWSTGTFFEGRQTLEVWEVE